MPRLSGWFLSKSVSVAWTEYYHCRRLLTVSVALMNFWTALHCWWPLVNDGELTSPTSYSVLWKLRNRTYRTPPTKLSVCMFRKPEQSRTLQVSVVYRTESIRKRSKGQLSQTNASQSRNAVLRPWSLS